MNIQCDSCMLIIATPSLISRDEMDRVVSDAGWFVGLKEKSNGQKVHLCPDCCKVISQRKR